MKNLIQTMFFFLLVAQICFAQWYPQNSGTTKSLNDVVFLNEYTGIAVGDSGLILRTTNGGANWSVIPTNVYDNLTSVSFIDSEIGWVGSGDYSDSALVLRTLDSGLSWYVQAKLNLYKLNDIFFVDQNFGFIVGWQGGGSGHNLYSTTDGGETWSGTTFPTIRILQRIYLLDQNTWWILGSDCGRILCNSTIYRTTDGGNSWQTQMEELGPELHDISFTDFQNGIVVGNLSPVHTFEGVIYRTTDGGETWLENHGPPFGGFDFIDVFHISNNIIAIWGINYDMGDVFYWSTDGGVTWKLRGSYQNVPLHQKKIFFTDTSNGWAVGDGGIILYTTNGGVSFVEEEQTSEVPTKFLLSQNYPNPFNPSTKIKYSIPKSSQVQIKVYDVLGNEIETLVNEEKPSGNYELTWNSANLPSGVYFCKLQAGSYIESKKMLLLK